jgi:hypothetical protein
VRVANALKAAEVRLGGLAAGDEDVANGFSSQATPGDALAVGKGCVWIGLHNIVGKKDYRLIWAEKAHHLVLAQPLEDSWLDSK